MQSSAAKGRSNDISQVLGMPYDDGGLGRLGAASEQPL
jgi:hypothetical protein